MIIEFYCLLILQYHNYLNLLLTYHLDHNKLNLDSGTELSYISNTVKFHMRAGYKDLFLGNNVDSHFTYGTGLTLKTSTGIGIGIDFAQVPFEYLGQTTIVDVKLYY